MENIIATAPYPLSTVGGLIIAPDGEILLVRSHKWNHLYSLPGGKIERGESMEEAFIREVKEETALTIENVTYAITLDSIYSEEFWKSAHFIMVNYISNLSNCSKEDVLLNEEAQEYLWISPENAIDLPLNQPTRSLINWYLQNRSFTSTQLRCNRLALSCSIGILPHELSIKQMLFISLEVEVKEMFDYRELASCVTRVSQKKHYPLIEDLAKEIIKSLKEQFGVSKIKVLIEKPSAIEGAEAAAVEMSVRGLL